MKKIQASVNLYIGNNQFKEIQKEFEKEQVFRNWLLTMNKNKGFVSGGSDTLAMFSGTWNWDGKYILLS